MTRKDVSEAAGIGMTTLYKFETGNMKDITFRTLIRLLRAIGLAENWVNFVVIISGLYDYFKRRYC